VMPTLDLGAIKAAGRSALPALRKFEGLWSDGKATERDFLGLVKLLHRVGCPTEAEYLLRTNLLVFAEDDQPPYEDKARLAVYVELFGTAKQEEFAVGIAAFSKQFSAKLTHARRDVSFWHGYNIKPRRACLGRYGLRDEPCYVNFEYQAKDCIEAQMWSSKSEDRLIFLGWAQGAWEILGPGIGCVGSEEQIAEPGRRSGQVGS
jgi:hypothetical protein